MFYVKNKRLIRKLAARNLKNGRTRNIVAISAITLTTVLFTSIFITAFSLNEYFQQEMFRQVGGYSHASLKEITYGQAEEFIKDENVKRTGLRYFLGVADKAPFDRCQVEVSYMDSEAADIYFSVPEKGSLPDENSPVPQLATDTYVLQLLDIKPEIGAKVPLSFRLDNGDEITETFSLSGWWEHDSAIKADMVLVSKGYCDKVLKDYKSVNEYEGTGKWTLEIFFNNSFDIEGKLEKLLASHNYQSAEAGREDYISAGINWGYSSTQVLNGMDWTTAAGIALALFVVIITGYLVIYNIFRISVSNDIHFYGLLKTIGTTRKQLRKIIFIQALSLSVAGIPAGLLAGCITGNALVKAVEKGEGYKRIIISSPPAVFIISAVFALVTVFISCFKPSRIAGKVSPAEAVSYTDINSTQKSTSKHGKNKKRIHRAGIVYMAFANTGRNKVKTGLVVTSLVLSVLILDFTISLARGFDMDKFTSKFYTTDFIIGKNDYLSLTNFYTGNGTGEEVIEEINKQKGISETGCIYGTLENITTPLSKEEIENLHKGMGWPIDEEYREYLFSDEENGRYNSFIQLYGMDKLALQQLKVIEGDIYKASENDNYIIEVIESDDYDNPIKDTEINKINDKITLTYGNKYFYYDKKTGKEADENTPEKRIGVKELEQKKVTYTVCAKVMVPVSVSYRSFSGKQYILGSQAFIKGTGTDNVMAYLVNADEAEEENIEQFLKDYTTNTDITLGYESKLSYQKNFENYRDLFVNVGTAAAFIVGFIGMLNFFNTIFTGINARKYELAVLQAVGMTGRQLKEMLVCEGLVYTCLASVISFITCIIAEPLLMDAVSSVFWFFTKKITLFPLLVLAPVYAIIGAAVPLILYSFIARKPVVDRLRI